jgi:iron complex transport system substrate-binding protein
MKTPAMTTHRMTAHAMTRLLTVALVVSWSVAAATQAAPHRIVSVIPAVTEMIFAIGEGSRVIGVGAYDRYPPQVEHLDRVGGLLDPNVEKILSLKPDLVIVYNTQTDLKARLARSSIPFYSYEHRELSDVMQTIRSVGARIGAAPAANRLATTMEQQLDDIRRSVAGLPKPKTLLVLGREPGSLRRMNVSGGFGFLHDMLVTAGGADAFADVKQQSIDASTEMILGRQPEVILELRYGQPLDAAAIAREIRAWDALPSVPAVRTHRVYVLAGDEFVVPGPRIVDATRRFADTLHPNRH